MASSACLTGNAFNDPHLRLGRRLDVTFIHVHPTMLEAGSLEVQYHRKVAVLSDHLSVPSMGHPTPIQKERTRRNDLVCENLGTLRMAQLG